MPKSALFAASFLSVCLALPLASSVFAADLRPVKEPAKIAAVFPAAAKVRVLNVWAMWCVPCVAEMPDLRAIDDAFGREVAIAGVTLDDMLPDAKPVKTAEFLDRQKIAFPNVYYTGNADDLGDRLRFSGEIPITIVYDAKGNELWRQEGRLDRDKIIARLRETLRRMR
jgi:thiol-disulfide isomerase/thioredoxin